MGPDPSQIADKAIAFVESDVGAAYVEGLTGKSPEDWARDLGKPHREALQDAEAESAVEDYATDEATASDVVPERCEPVLQMITSMTRLILALDTESLEEIGIGHNYLLDALEARTEFYQACYDDREVKRIGFSPEDSFPITHSSFPERAQKPERKKKEEEEPEWLVAEDLIRVDSPNWDQDMQRSRQWLGVDQKNRRRYFMINDAEFWTRIRKKELPFEGSDQLQVQ
jgi:hypothetical protein